MDKQIFKDIEIIKAIPMDNLTPQENDIIGDLLTEIWYLLDNKNTFIFRNNHDATWENVIEMINLYHTRLDVRGTDVWDATYLINCLNLSENDAFIKTHRRLYNKILHVKDSNYLLNLYEKSEKKYLIWKKRYDG